MGKFKELLKTIFTRLPEHVGIYTTILICASYHLIFDQDFTCTSKPQHLQVSCWVHLFLPWVIILILQLSIDKGFKNACNKCACVRDCCPDGCQCCSCNQDCRGALCCAAVVHFIQALSVSTIWIVSVLLDGDWFVCCQNNDTTTQAQTDCTNGTLRTPEEPSSVADLRSRSRTIGLCVLLTAASMASLAGMVRDCCYKTEVDLIEVILEEAQSEVLKLLKVGVKDKLTKDLKTYMDTEQWGQCPNAAEKLIKLITSQIEKANQPKDSAGKGPSSNVQPEDQVPPNSCERQAEASQTETQCEAEAESDSPGVGRIFDPLLPSTSQQPEAYELSVKSAPEKGSNRSL